MHVHERMSELKLNEIKRNITKWNDMIWYDMKWRKKHEMKWNEMNEWMDRIIYVLIDEQMEECIKERAYVLTRILKHMFNKINTKLWNIINGQQWQENKTLNVWLKQESEETQTQQTMIRKYTKKKKKRWLQPHRIQKRKVNETHQTLKTTVNIVNTHEMQTNNTYNNTEKEKTTALAKLCLVVTDEKGLASQQASKPTILNI